MNYAYSINQEDFFGDFAIPEDAAFEGILESISDYWENGDSAAHVSVGEKISPDMSCPVDADDIIERLQETEDFGVECSENFDPSQEEREDLTKRINEAWNSWINVNKINPGFFLVKNVKEWQMVFQPDFEPDFEAADLGARGVLKVIEK